MDDDILLALMLDEIMYKKGGTSWWEGIKGFFTGVRQTKPPNVKKTLEQYGNQKIIHIKICKAPVKGFIETALNWLSFGKYEEKKKELNYDKMIHVYALLTLQSGTDIIFEKNQVVNISVYHKPKEQYGICMDIDLQGKEITLNEYINNTIKRMGEPTIWLYNGENSTILGEAGNCQNFLDNSLSANGLNKGEYKDYILQNANKIIGALPSYVKDLARGVTDWAARFDRILQGGIKKKNLHKIYRL